MIGSHYTLERRPNLTLEGRSWFVRCAAGHEFETKSWNKRCACGEKTTIIRRDKPEAERLGCDRTRLYT